MSSDASLVALGAGRERRLHPLSWLFVMLASLREFAFPLVALLVFGSRGEQWEQWQWFGLVGAAALPLLAVVRYYTYRFRIADGELVIRSGVLHRNVRHIPLQRIQNVLLKRNLLHRAFGVAEVKLESAVGGMGPEAQMRVLSMRDAHALEVLVRASANASLADADGEAEPEQGEVLLVLPAIELVKLGLTSNRGLLLGAAGAGVFSQFGGDAWIDLVSALTQSLFGYARGLHVGPFAWFLAGTLAWATVVLLMKLVSIVMMLTQFHGFTLREIDARLSVESGLFTRVRSNAPLRKIQHWTLREGWLHRLFARRSVRVETAVLEVGKERQGGLSDIVPIAPPDTVDALITRWLPWLRMDDIEWQPVHARAWRRMAFAPVLITVLGSIVLAMFTYGAGFALLLLVPWWTYRARQLASRANWAVTDRVLAWRSGWLDRKVSFAEIGKLQGLQLVQSPFDRRRGMATLVADTAGASPFGHRLELRYLPEAKARALYEQVGARIARSTLAW